MDRQAVIERLEDLRDHCQSMIDKDDPASIWWGDTEALTEAIKALSLDIDKNQKSIIDFLKEQEADDGAKENTETGSMLRGLREDILQIPQPGQQT